MKTRTILAALAPLALFAVVMAQTWESSYDRALVSARAGNWAEAREFFKQAINQRAEDQARPTNLPGPISEPRVWRRGAPYSPNFGAAYAAYRQGIGTTDEAEGNRLLVLAAQEFEALVAKGQLSTETAYFLGKIYDRLKNAEGKKALETAAAGGANWRVDTIFLAEDDMASLRGSAPEGQGNQTQGNQGQSQQNPRSNPRDNRGNRNQNSNQGSGQIVKIRAGEEKTFRGGASMATGPVATREDKFALIVGNTETKIEDQKVEFAATDAALVQKALVETAGYKADHVTLLTNATSTQIMDAAKALAERVPDGGVVMIYFSGVAVNLDGKDYYTGTDTEFATNTQSMVGKSELFRLFMVRGARIFAFNQTHRPIREGNYFGKEVAIVGAISQVHATIAGDKVFSIFQGGNQVGLYTSAMTQVFGEFRSNSIPVTEFAWEVFYTVRRGSTGGVGGGSIQTPTLPIRTNLSDDARF